MPDPVICSYQKGYARYCHHRLTRCRCPKLYNTNVSEFLPWLSFHQRLTPWPMAKAAILSYPPQMYTMPKAATVLPPQTYIPHAQGRDTFMSEVRRLVLKPKVVLRPCQKGYAWFCCHHRLTQCPELFLSEAIIFYCFHCRLTPCPKL